VLTSIPSAIILAIIVVIASICDIVESALISATILRIPVQLRPPANICVTLIPSAISLMICVPIESTRSLIPAICLSFLIAPMLRVSTNIRGLPLIESAVNSAIILLLNLPAFVLI
jgi:hypothetical protein